MFNASEFQKSGTNQLTEALGTNGKQRFDGSTKVICDLAEGDAFVETQRKPHIPVMSAFGAGRLHQCRLQGSWDLDRAVSENARALFRSVRMLPCKDAKEAMEEWDDLTFRFGPQSFVYLDKNRIVGFATTPMEAESLVKQFSNAYRKAPPPPNSAGEFYLIRGQTLDIDSHKVTLPHGKVLTAEMFSFHYGAESEVWHQRFVEKLRTKDRGISILEGSPGTGKTFYIRYLMGELKESHRFYFIPTSSLNVLSRADFIEFWNEQRKQFSNSQFVVILEDSDAALMTRGTDNREQVSTILNLSDGLLGDFLRLHIICTINCSSAEIDPALLRPGRLLCHRVFKRLDYEQAARLAEKLGKKLPTASDYSLAEVFGGNEAPVRKRPPIGFAMKNQTDSSS